VLQTQLILDRLYRVPRRSRRERLQQRWRQFRRTFARWLEYQSWSFALGTVSLVCLLLATAYYYNKLLTLEYEVQLAWARVEAGEQRRSHVTRNLANLLDYYTRHEKDLMKDVTKQRTAAGASSAGASNGEALGQILGRLNAVAEQYPNLQVTKAVQLFSTTVVNTESEIAFYIIGYNNAINTYTITLNTYPAKVFGKLLGFGQYRYYKPKDPARLAFQELKL
jgi:LemA protein